MKWLDKLPWLIIIVTVVTLGLAPYMPEPHAWQKLNMLVSGSLSKPIDIFDLVLHVTPWVLLVLKFIRQMTRGI